jgi:methionine synthase I (cobalamin-dependent)
MQYKSPTPTKQETNTQTANRTFLQNAHIEREVYPKNKKAIRQAKPLTQKDTPSGGKIQ